MIVVLAIVKAKAGMEKDLENALRDMISKVESESGTLAYTLHRAKNDPTQFFVYEKYLNDEAFSKHISTPYFAQVSEKVGSLLDGAPVLDMYEELVGIKR